jgi:hypothetical protein
MTLRSTPTYLQGGSHPAENVRLMTQSLLGGVTGAYDPTTDGYDPGCAVARSGDLTVTQNGTPNMSVNVAAGGCYVRNTLDADGGVYHAYNDAPVNLTIAASDPSNPRWDLVCVAVKDSEYDGSDDEVELVVVTGTPDAAPSDPALPDNALVLARVVVAAGVSSITTAAITNLAGVARPWNSAWGTVFATTSLSSFTFTTSAGESSTFTWRAVAGRRYNVSVAAQFQSAGTTPQVASVSVKTSAGAEIVGNLLQWSSRNSGEQFRSGATFSRTPNVNADQVWKLSAVSTASASTQTIAAIVVTINDVGPA